MKCLNCGASNWRVLESRDSKEPGRHNQIRRRRECLGCGVRFKTFEIIAGDLEEMELARLAQISQAIELLKGVVSNTTGGDSDAASA